MKFKVLTLSLLMLSPAAFSKTTKYPFIKNVNLKNFPLRDRIKYHQLFSKTIQSLSASEKYPKYVLERKVSSLNLLNIMSDFLIDSSIANSSSNVCLFGGWPSNKSGTCQVPFQSSGVAVANQVGIDAYDSDDYCGSKNLFRCNPNVFGPGIEANEEITAKFGNINGNKNNSAPYSAGICVDVSKGYNNLTNDCATISKELDKLREKPWREEYFASSKHENFKKMQSTISTICEERAEKRTNDSMCDNLEESLGLTFAAVSAGSIADVNVEDLFPGCGGSVPAALPTCSSEDHQSLTNLREAISEIQNDPSCRFKSVSVEVAPERPVRNHGRSKIYGDLPEPVVPESASQCKTYIAEKLKPGLSEDTNVNIFFKGTAVDDLDYITVALEPDMTKEEIIAAIKNGDNGDVFKNTCAVSTCPSTDAPGSKVLYDVMNHLRTNKDCHFKNIQVVDQNTNRDGNFEKSQCEQSIEGALAAEGLGSDNQEIMFLVTDAKGELNTGALIVNANSSSTKEDILKQFEKGENKGVYGKACNRTTKDFFTDYDLAAQELGFGADQFIAENQKELIVKLANLKRRGKDVEVSIAPNGDIVAKPRVAVLNETTGMNGASHPTELDAAIFRADFPAQMEYFKSQIEGGMPKDIEKLITDFAGDLRISDFSGENGSFTFTVDNASKNILGEEQKIQNGKLITAKGNDDGTFSYSIATATHDDQIMLKRQADEERARYIASNSEERSVCVEKNRKGRCVKKEMRMQYCAEKGRLWGCNRWEDVEK